MTVATALAVSWKPFTNSKPSAKSKARPRKAKAPMARGSPAAEVSRSTLNPA